MVTPSLLSAINCVGGQSESFVGGLTPYGTSRDLNAVRRGRNYIQYEQFPSIILQSVLVHLLLS